MSFILEKVKLEKINKMNEELSELMMYTGIKDTDSFDSSVLYIK